MNRVLAIHLHRLPPSCLLFPTGAAPRPDTCPLASGHLGAQLGALSGGSAIFQPWWWQKCNQALIGGGGESLHSFPLVRPPCIESGVGEGSGGLGLDTDPALGEWDGSHNRDIPSDYHLGISMAIKLKWKSDLLSPQDAEARAPN